MKPMIHPGGIVPLLSYHQTEEAAQISESGHVDEPAPDKTPRTS